MLARINSATTIGLDCTKVEVEVDIASYGLPSFNIVGLGDKAVEEAKERVRSAIKNSGADFPARRITVNLAPADLPKEGPAFDLAIALGILFASGQFQSDLSDSLVLGELSLDGSLRHTRGVLPLALFAKENRFSRVFLPKLNGPEASIIRGIKVYAVESLLAFLRFLNGDLKIDAEPPRNIFSILTNTSAEFDFSEIQGQEQAKRAAEIAAAGGHNIFMRGVPGSGKTMLARALPGILPRLSEEEALEVTKIYSITGNLNPGQSIVTSRPFRSPHHTTSRIGLIGGGTNPVPGEISLAHRGVLFLDEFAEFPRNVLEALRQPMEDGIVTISRARGRISYPSKFLLVAASNPCPCGYFGDTQKPCTCLPGQILRYQKRISGPIMDRIDIHLDVPPVPVEKLTGNIKYESSKQIQKRVQKARDIQLRRYKKDGIVSNAELNTRQVKKFCELDNKGVLLLRQAISQMNLSARSYYKVIKVARTIADLEGSKEILPAHIAESLQYRPKIEENSI